MRRWLIYALGGGLGHAVRCAALARALGACGVRAKLLCAAEAKCAAQALFDGELVVLEHEQHRDAQQLRERVQQELEGSELLLLDTFPCGIYQELRGLPRDVPRLLISRLQRAPLAALESEAGWSELGLCGVVDIEPNLGWLLGPAVRCGPVARRLIPAHLTPEPSSPGIQVEVALTKPEVRGQVGALLERFGMAYAVPVGTLASTYSAGIVVGAAGYNLSYELARAGIWHVALPERRPVDDQSRRARHLGTLVSSPEAFERRLRTLLSAARRLETEVLGHEELAERLVAYVDERVGRSG